MSTGDWVKLLLAAGAVAIAVKVAGGPSKRPSVDGLPVYQNGNSHAPEPGDPRYHSGPRYC